MLEFSPADPFPLLAALPPELYPAAKKHAAAADEWLGLRVEGTEARLRDPRDGEERWLGRHSSIWLTPYVELRFWLEQLGLGGAETLVDLGAGYGRLGFVLARHFPGCRFLGYELVAERVREGNAALARFGATNACLEVANLADPGWSPPPADLYFIYDFGTKASIAKMLEDLRALAAGGQKIRVVGRGRAVRDQIEREHPWLGSVHAPVHGPHYSLYRSFE